MAKKGEFKEHVLKRRRELAHMIFMGVDKSEAFEKIAELHDVKPHTVRCDWSQREDWLRKVFDIEVDEEVIELILSEQRFVRDKYMEIYRTAKSESTKLGCLNSVRDANEQLIDLMQKLGILDKQKDKLEITGKMEMTSMAKMAEDWMSEGNDDE